jgi:hypothetical protein
MSNYYVMMMNINSINAFKCRKKYVFDNLFIRLGLEYVCNKLVLLKGMGEPVNKNKKKL